MFKKKRNSFFRGNYKKSKKIKAQTTVFIIIAIMIVLGLVLYFVFSGGIGNEKVPRELEPVYSYYLSCIEEEVLDAANILGQRGGYIENIEFSPGSSYMPFSSELNFLGTGVPYWYYISGNGVVNERIPSKIKLGDEINNYVKDRLDFCDFSEFRDKGFNISIGNAEVESSIEDNLISVNVKQPLTISFGDFVWSGNGHSVDVQSNLGKFYDLAKKIYLNNKEFMFLENYAVDILRLYAPVDGSEIGCSPKIWNVEEIRGNLIEALESNVPMTKVKGDYYTLSKEENKYFVRDLGENVDVNVNFLYSSDWPMKMEVWPSEDGILRADPVGLQEGLGMLGFCYVPYHFIYDFAYPVLIQIYSGNELFQFPVVVFIDKNNPRESLDAEGIPDVVPELCIHKNNALIVSTYNTNLEPIESNIGFKCFDTTCDIGRTEIQGNDAILNADFPQCVNGYIVASAEGYETRKYLVEILDEKSISVVLDKKYKLDLEIQQNGATINDYAVITFNKDNGKKTIVAYPNQREVELTEGQYQVEVYVYSNSTINVQGSKTEKCVEVPKSGILGVFGFSEEKCFDMKIPDQIVSSAISGGGKQSHYISESELRSSGRMIINSKSFGVPNSVESLQINYNSLEVSRLDIWFD